MKSTAPKAPMPYPKPPAWYYRRLDKAFVKIKALHKQLAAATDDPEKTRALRAALTQATKELPETDGIPLENYWQVPAIHLLIEVITHRMRHREDYFAGGNVFIYYNAERRRNRDFRGPDFFFVDGGVEMQKERSFWAVWEENYRFPDFIIELMSHSSVHNDLVVKKKIYEEIFRTPEYVSYDPHTETLRGWRLREGKYTAIELDARGWLWSEVLGLWVGKWEGVVDGYRNTWLRFYGQDGQMVPHKCEEEEERANAAEKRAEAARQRAEAARKLIDAAEAELQALQAQLQACKNGANGAGHPK